MKYIIATIALVSATTLTSYAGKGCSGHDHHGHAHIKAGPNKGRLLPKVSPQAEFLVRHDRKVQITFYDDKMKVIEPSTQVVSVLTGKRSAPVEMNFKSDGKALISDKKVPAGKKFPTIIAIKSNVYAEEVVTKFTLDLSDCTSCENKEYACECHH